MGRIKAIAGLTFACAALAVSAAPAPAQNAITMRLDGGPPSEVSRFSQKITNPVTLGTTTTGATASKALFGPMKIEKPVDGASLELYKRLVSGQPFGFVQVQVSNGPFSMSYCMKTVLVSYLRQSSDRGDSSIFEEVELRYTSLTERQGANAFGWSVVLNRLEVLPAGCP